MKKLLLVAVGMVVTLPCSAAQAGPLINTRFPFSLAAAPEASLVPFTLLGFAAVWLLRRKK